MIAKLAPYEKAFPNKWMVPGEIDVNNYMRRGKDNPNEWYNEWYKMFKNELCVG